MRKSFHFIQGNFFFPSLYCRTSSFIPLLELNGLESVLFLSTEYFLTQISIQTVTEVGNVNTALPSCLLVAAGVNSFQVYMAYKDYYQMSNSEVKLLTLLLFVFFPSKCPSNHRTLHAGCLSPPSGGALHHEVPLHWMEQNDGRGCVEEHCSPVQVSLLHFALVLLQLYDVFTFLAERGAIAQVHAENGEIIAEVCEEDTPACVCVCV